LRLVLIHPDIPQNTGAMLRLAACLDTPVDLVEPAGFVLSDRRLRRAGMDYLDGVDLTRHASWAAFLAAQSSSGRLVLLSTRGAVPYTQFRFAADDRLMVGSEASGAPAEVHAAADAVVRIPMRAGLRSLNVALAAAMVLGEALRQTAAPQLQD
jgi:tRNA (cytidine/uridine-2'-O-)-methyltransferase